MAAKSEGADMGVGGFEGDVAGGDEGEVSVKEREVSVNGLSMKTAEVEAKLDDGNIEEAESSLREGLSLNYEVDLFLPRLLFLRAAVVPCESYGFSLACHPLLWFQSIHYGSSCSMPCNYASDNGQYSQTNFPSKEVACSLFQTSQTKLLV